MGEGPPQWLATGALECRSGVALQPEPGAPQPNRNKNLHGPNVPSHRSGLEPVSLPPCPKAPAFWSPVLFGGRIRGIQMQIFRITPTFGK